MVFASSAINIRFSLKRDAAPEKVKAIRRPNKAKTAPSTGPRLLRSPSDSLGRRLSPKRRPASSRMSMPKKRNKENKTGETGGSMKRAPLQFNKPPHKPALNHFPSQT